MGSDILDLTGTAVDFTDIASVEALAVNAVRNGQTGTLIDTGNGDSVFIAGLTTNDLTSVDFLF